MGIPLKNALGNPAMAEALRRDAARSLEERGLRMAPATVVCSFTVPGKPLSVNRLHATSRKRKTRFLSREGVAYKALAAWHAKEAMGGRLPFIGKCAVTLDWYFKTAAPDCDGPIKPMLDAISGVVYEDDRQVVEIRATKRKDKALPRAVVTVVELP